MITSIYRTLFLLVCYLYCMNVFGDDSHDHTFSDIGICIYAGCGKYEPPTTNDGYRMIENLGNLYWLSSNAASNFKAKLNADIIINENVLNTNGEPNDNSFRTWVPIGTQNQPFTGVFDGQGHTISGIYMNTPGVDCLGLFAYVKGATIINVTLIDSYICGKEKVGGFVGNIVDNNNYNRMATIVNCYNYATIYATGSYCGGICGYQKDESYSHNVNQRCVIEKCTNYGLVTGESYVGGIVGQSNNVAIQACGNYNIISCKNKYVGGICGYTTGTNKGITTINRCINCTATSGAIVGYAAFKTAINYSCYLDGLKMVGDKHSESIEISTNSNNAYTIDQMKTGIAAYKMNLSSSGNVNYWYQTINSDNYPVLSDTHGTVYKVTAKCCFKNMTTSEGYSNSNTSDIIVLDNLEHIAAVRPSCTVEGNIDYYKCKNTSCGRIYTSASSNADNEKTQEETRIPVIERGDVNGDRRIDADDISACVKFINKDTNTDDLYQDAADYDQNGKITITDVVNIISIANTRAQK